MYSVSVYGYDSNSQPNANYSIVLRDKSPNWLGDTTSGAPNSRSDPLCVLGNAITSLIDSEFVNMLTSLSIPGAIPPCGGAPYSKASNMCPNKACTC